jgi:hypothetical protein
MGVAEGADDREVEAAERASTAQGTPLPSTSPVFQPPPVPRPPGLPLHCTSVSTHFIFYYKMKCVEADVQCLYYMPYMCLAAVHRNGCDGPLIHFMR